MRSITLNNVSKSFDGETVIKNLSLDIPGGAFFVLLGPSGCGKTTLLRLIAGLEEADSGSIKLGKENITKIPIHKRKVNTVFQQYALFPHFTVGENIAYPLKIKGIEKEEIRERVKQTLKIVRLINQEHRYPRNLSGGQQQRVALARAIISRPDVLLLDEPFAALDLKLKEQMLLELIDIQDKLRTTFVYITHDQGEALTVADKMAIMSEGGVIEQIGTPKQIYEFPESRFVAQFVGTTNFINGKFSEGIDGYHQIQTEYLGSFDVFFPQEKAWLKDKHSVTLSIRPEKIFITKKKSGDFANELEGRVVDILYYGFSTQYRVLLKNGRYITVFTQNAEHIPKDTIDYDDDVYLYFAKEDVVLLERE